MSKSLRIARLALLLIGLLAVPLVLAQEADDQPAKKKGGKKSMQAQIESLAQQTDALKAGQEAITKQLNEIKRMLRTTQQAKRQPPRQQGPQVKDVIFNLGSNDIKGAKDAKLTLLEFTDYQ